MLEELERDAIGPSCLVQSKTASTLIRGQPFIVCSLSLAYKEAVYATPVGSEEYSNTFGSVFNSKSTLPTISFSRLCSKDGNVDTETGDIAAS